MLKENLTNIRKYLWLTPIIVTVGWMFGIWFSQGLNTQVDPVSSLLAIFAVYIAVRANKTSIAALQQEYKPMVICREVEGSVILTDNEGTHYQITLIVENYGKGVALDINFKDSFGNQLAQVWESKYLVIRSGESWSNKKNSLTSVWVVFSETMVITYKDIGGKEFKTIVTLSKNKNSTRFYVLQNQFIEPDSIL